LVGLAILAQQRQLASKPIGSLRVVFHI
jgi:hypothetical protein